MKLDPRAASDADVSHPIDPTSFTPHFGYKPTKQRPGNGSSTLFCEGTSVEAIAATVGTPAYVYSRASISGAYKQLDAAFASLPHALCYAVKANANLSVLRLLAKLGSRFDVVSGGEMARLRHIKVRGRSIVFSGVGKSRDEIREALRYRNGKDVPGIFMFNVESAAEMEVLLSEASKRKNRSRGVGDGRVGVAIRINPDVQAGGHPHISTGYRQHKFGMDWSEARQIYLAHRNSKWILWRGISAHIGSQILTVDPFRRALERVAGCVKELAGLGIALQCVDFGGGLGIRYTDEPALDLAEYARELTNIVRPLGCQLLLEPGRWIVGPAGVLLTRVLYMKENGGRKFAIVDAGMNDLIRPVLYDATHAISKASINPDAETSATSVDVVGPVCETGDYLGRDVPLTEVKAGDLLVVWTAGAYGFVESSNYNARPRAVEVMAKGKKFRVIRKRETVKDMWRGEP
jgi:diaminopimelate decarboxylase